MWFERGKQIHNSGPFRTVGEDFLYQKEILKLEVELENLFLFKRKVLAAAGVDYILS